MMKTIKINIKDKVKNLIKLHINNIEVVDGNYLLSFDNNISELSKNQNVYYIRKIQNSDGVYETIIEDGIILEENGANQLLITPPSNKFYSVEMFLKNNKNSYRLKTKEKINLFQQDIEESRTQEVYLYDETFTKLKTYTSGNFGIPLLYDDEIVNVKDCCVLSMKLKGCNNICDGNNLTIYDYYFMSSGVSRNDIIINETDETVLNKTKYISFKYTPFTYGNNNIELFSDIWASKLKDEENGCVKYNIIDDYSTIIAVDDSYYKMGINLIDSTDYIGLGNEDNFDSSFVEELQDSLIPNFIDMERVKYSPCSRRVKDGDLKDKYLKWSTVRGTDSCDDVKYIYTKNIPLVGDIASEEVYFVNKNGEFGPDNYNETTTKKYKFGYETGPFFENGIMPTIYKYYDDYDNCKYYLTNELYDENDITITGITFCMHFLKRKEITVNERHLNSIYTSGNVYHDSWHIDPDFRENTWWNGFNYKETTIPYTGSSFSLTDFNEFDSKFGETSDLIGYLNFTDNDIFLQKKKVSQSFLRLSFYSSKDPIEQKLLYYSTIFLDGNELYGKYVKQLDYLHRDGVFDSMLINCNENAMVVLHYGDYNTDKNGVRIDSEITVTNEYNKSKSSEGFNIYLFSEDKNFETEKGEKTIYMKVEFNHAGNGKTVPLILWPKKLKNSTCNKCGKVFNEKVEFCDECQSREFSNTYTEEYVPLTTENYIDSLFIEVKVSYTNGRYVYYIPRAIEKEYNLKLVLYEPKLDEIKDNKVS